MLLSIAAVLRSPSSNLFSMRRMGRKDCDGNDLPEEGLIPR